MKYYSFKDTDMPNLFYVIDETSNNTKFFSKVHAGETSYEVVFQNWWWVVDGDIKNECFFISHWYHPVRRVEDPLLTPKPEYSERDVAIICHCFQLALEGNGEKMGSVTECAIFSKYLNAYPCADELLEVAVKWVGDYDLGVHRFKEIHGAL